MIGPMILALINARGSYEKQRILTKYDSAGVRKILQYTYNTHVTYGIKPGKVSPINVVGRTDDLRPEEIHLLHALSNRDLVGTAAVQAVESCYHEHGGLIKLILDRDLQCGIAAKTINKAIPYCVPMFEVQLAKEVPLDKVKFPMWAQLKYDGVRLITIVKDGQITFRTRNGKFVLLPDMAERIRTANLDDCVLDGELIFNDGNVETRTSVSGMVNSAMHGGSIDESKLTYMLFDSLAHYDFNRCKSDVPYDDRYMGALTAVQLVGRPLKLADQYLVKSAEEVNSKSSELYSLGYEGLILKKPHHLYSFKRSPDWVKIKETKTADLSVLGAVEGTGKYELMIGALDCHGTVEGKRVLVTVGSGLTDAERSYPMNYFDDKIIEVKYNSLIKHSRTGEWSLFLPRFSHVRVDR